MQTTISCCCFFFFALRASGIYRMLPWSYFQLLFTRRFYVSTCR